MMEEERTTHDDQTMTKVYEGIRAGLGPFADAVKVEGIVSELQNRGILFRERA